MRFLAVLLLVAYCEARPGLIHPALFEPGHGSFIVGGVPAGRGEFPWQLSQQRLGSTWSHSCGASLLSSRYALSAAHCVDGAAVANLRVIAGLHLRDDMAGSTTSNLVGYTMHARYNVDPSTFSNDIAILTLSTSIDENGGTIGFASLPADNADDFAGQTCVMSGWGRTSASQALPNELQKASIEVIDNTFCNQLVGRVSGASVAPTAICLYDTANQIGSCNGDSGGPLTCMEGSNRVVSGVTSWGMQSGGACLQTYPSVYTRTSTYLDWIAANTP